MPSRLTRTKAQSQLRHGWSGCCGESRRLGGMMRTCAAEAAHVAFGRLACSLRRVLEYLNWRLKEVVDAGQRTRSFRGLMADFNHGGWRAGTTDRGRV